MIRRLLILAFVVGATANSLSAMPLFMDSGACATGCCQQMRLKQPSSPGARLCCLLECPQPADANRPATRVAVRPAERQNAVLPISATATLLYLKQTKFPSTPTRFIRGSTDHFLLTGALLI
jgi:hypothetical protein